MALFLVMIIFLGTDLILVRAGTYVEAGWRKQREDLFDVEKTNTSIVHRPEAVQSTSSLLVLLRRPSGRILPHPTIILFGVGHYQLIGRALGRTLNVGVDEDVLYVLHVLPDGEQRVEIFLLDE